MKRVRAGRPTRILLCTRSSPSLTVAHRRSRRMGCGGSSPVESYDDEQQPEEEQSALVRLLDSHGRQWRGPEAGIFFERDPAPAIIAHCAELGIEFEDPDFNPDGAFPDGIANSTSPLANRSLSPDGAQTLGKIFFEHSVAKGTWLRSRDIPRDGADLRLVDQLSVTDVNQGGVGNCWLCAVICAAINYAPGVVASAVSPPEPNAAGCYSVRLWVEGRPLYIPVDDRMYCVDGVPLDMHSNQKHELYVSILAKAFTKWLLWYDLNGDERDDNRTIDEGVVLYCLRALTGSGDAVGKETKWQSQSSPRKGLLIRKRETPTADVVPHADAAAAVRAVFESGAAVTCGGAEEKMGLVDTHAYTVLWHGVVAGVELVQLRNPHGGGGGGRDWEEGEWQGAWSDNDAMWDQRPDVKAALEELRGEYGSAPRDGARQPYWEKRFAHDGIFFMAFDDFLSRFTHIEHARPPFGGVTQAERAAFETEHRGQPSTRWRIRPVASGITRWDVSNLRFIGQDGDELVPASAIESGSAADALYDHTPGWDAHGMLFGGESFAREEGCWGGRCPDGDALGPWVGAVFEVAVVVASVTMKQSDFTEVLLEQCIEGDGVAATWLKAQMFVGLPLEDAY